jgi:aryl-alcohol dehydrogenase-like predicted oxidoreductase
LRGLPRDSYVLSTKFSYKAGAGAGAGAEARAELDKSLERSLAELETDHIDVFHIHALIAQDYAFAREELLPQLHWAKQAGKIRFIGVTERFAMDRGHEMLQRVLPDDLFDVVMAGYNILNPSAAGRVLPLTIRHNVAVLCMFAVRSALARPEQLKIDVARILAAGQGGAELNELQERALDFLTEGGVAADLPEAAYRFARHTPGITVTLTGTGNREHLLQNLRAIGEKPLPSAALERLDALFGGVDCVSGQ